MDRPRRSSSLAQFGLVLLAIDVLLVVGHLLWPDYRWGNRGRRESYFNLAHELTAGSWLMTLQLAAVAVLAMVCGIRAGRNRPGWRIGWFSIAVAATAFSLVEMTRMPAMLDWFGTSTRPASEIAVRLGLVWSGLTVAAVFMAGRTTARTLIAAWLGFWGVGLLGELLRSTGAIEIPLAITRGAEMIGTTLLVIGLVPAAVAPLPPADVIDRPDDGPGLGLIVTTLAGVLAGGLLMVLIRRIEGTGGALQATVVPAAGLGTALGLLPGLRPGSGRSGRALAGGLALPALILLAMVAPATIDSGLIIKSAFIALPFVALGTIAAAPCATARTLVTVPAGLAIGLLAGCVGSDPARLPILMAVLGALLGLIAVIGFDRSILRPIAGSLLVLVIAAGTWSIRWAPAPLMPSLGGSRIHASSTMSVDEAAVHDLAALRGGTVTRIVRAGAPDRDRTPADLVAILESAPPAEASRAAGAMFTATAIGRYLDVLSERGLLLIDTPIASARDEITTWHRLATIRAALARRSLNADDRVMVIQRSSGTDAAWSIVVGVRPFAPSDVQPVVDWCVTATFDRAPATTVVLAAPGQTVPSRARDILEGEISIRAATVGRPRTTAPTRFGLWWTALAIPAVLLVLAIGRVERSGRGLTLLAGGVTLGLGVVLLQETFEAVSSVDAMLPVVMVLVAATTALIWWRYPVPPAPGRTVAVAVAGIAAVLIAHLVADRWLGGQPNIALALIVGGLAAVIFAATLMRCMPAPDRPTRLATAVIGLALGIALGRFCGAAGGPLLALSATALGAALMTVAPVNRRIGRVITITGLAALLAIPWLSTITRRTDRVRVDALSCGAGPIRIDRIIETDDRQTRDGQWYIWLVRAGGRTILVNTGFADADAARAWGIEHPSSAIERLDALWLDADDVTDVVVLRNGPTAADGLGVFAGSRLWMTAQTHGTLLDTADADVLQSITSAEDHERLVLIDGPREVTDGVSLDVLNDGTGGLVLRADTAEGRVILAGDLVGLYEFVFRSRPAPRPDAAAAADRLKDFLHEAASPWFVVPAHDPAVLDHFPMTTDGVVRIGPTP